MRSIHTLPLVLVPLLAACVSTPRTALPSLTRLAAPSLDYTTELTDRGLLDGREAPSFEPASEGARVGVGCAVLSIDGETAEELMGGSGLRAFSTRTSEARDLLRACHERDGARLIQSPHLMLADGQKGYVTILNQTAYVSGFRLVQEETSLLADPVVDVFSYGMLLEAAAAAMTSSVEPSMSTVALDVHLSLASLRDPIAEYEVSIAGGIGSITIQEPTLTRQDLDTELQLAADECLVLITEDIERDDHMLVSLITARQLTAEEIEALQRTDINGADLSDYFGLGRSSMP